MDEATQRRIFEKFYQGDSAHATEGNGLGLSLVKRIVDLCGGTISVTSAPGEGTAFTVTLPDSPKT
jgi:signal transduction histidine kinase